MSTATRENLATGLDEALTESARELTSVIERHRGLLAAALGAQALESHGRCMAPACSCRRVLRRTLAETIAVLDDTRKSFKSRQLAVLRHKLVRILGEQE